MITESRSEAGREVGASRPAASAAPRVAAASAPARSASPAAPRVAASTPAASEPRRVAAAPSAATGTGTGQALGRRRPGAGAARGPAGRRRLGRGPALRRPGRRLRRRRCRARDAPESREARPQDLHPGGADGVGQPDPGAHRPVHLPRRRRCGARQGLGRRPDGRGPDAIADRGMARARLGGPRDAGGDRVLGAGRPLARLHLRAAVARRLVLRLFRGPLAPALGGGRAADRRSRARS